MATKAAPAPKAKAAPKDDIDAEIAAQLGEIESGDVDADEENPDEITEEDAVEDDAEAPEEAVEDGETEEDEVEEEAEPEAAIPAPEEDGAEDEPAPAKPAPKAAKAAKAPEAAPAKAKPTKAPKAAPAPEPEEAPAVEAPAAKPAKGKTGPKAPPAKAVANAKADAEATPAAKAVKNAKAKPTQAAKEIAEKVEEPVAEVVEPAPVPEADENGNYDPLRIYTVPFHAISVPKARRQRDESDYTAEAVKDLADDIAKVGLLNPIILAPSAKGGKFTLEAGERRLRAMESLNWPGATAQIMPSPDKATSVLRGLSENFQRKQIDAISEAKYLKGLIDGKVFESVAALAKACGYDAGGVTKKLTLLTLDGETQEQIRSGALAASAGYVIAAQAKKAEVAAAKAKEDAKAKAKESAKTTKPTAAPEEVEEEAEEAGEEAAEEVKEAAKGGKKTVATEEAKKAGRPLKHLSMKDIASPAVPLSDAVDLRVVRQPDETYDLEVRIQVGLGKAEKFSAETFNIEKALADAAKTEFGAMKKKIGVGIESMLRIFTAKKPKADK